MNLSQSNLLLVLAIAGGFAVVQFVAGILIGGWLRRRGSLRDTSAILEARRASDVASQLQELANGVASEVERHNSRVAAINRELTSFQENHTDPVASEVVGVVARAIQANEQLQQQLASAEARLQDQAAEIQNHVTASLTDSLTGLANRRAFDDELKRRLSEFSRTDRAASLIVLDVDHFKAFNDKYGHQAGDHVLHSVAKVLFNSTRDMDLVARYGGEEFAVILPSATLHSASKVADRIRMAVDSGNFEFEGTPMHVTISAGVAEFQPDDTVATLLKRADTALYSAKEAGRNRTFMNSGESCQYVEPNQDAMQASPSGSRRSRRANGPDDQNPSANLAGALELDSGLIEACEELRKRVDELMGRS